MCGFVDEWVGKFACGKIIGRIGGWVCEWMDDWADEEMND